MTNANISKSYDNLETPNSGDSDDSDIAFFRREEEQSMKRNQNQHESYQDIAEENNQPVGDFNEIHEDATRRASLEREACGCCISNGSSTWRPSGDMATRLMAV